MQTPVRILRIDASARHRQSFSRAITTKLMAKLHTLYPGAITRERDIYTDLPFLSESMITQMDAGANSAGLTMEMQYSDMLVKELQETDILVLGVPVYNFAIPASLKAYIDLVARAGITFRYHTNGFEGLLKHLEAYVVVTSNGTAMYSDSDFATSYLKHIFSFLGFKKSTFIDATQILLQGEDVVMAKAAQALASI